jgi:hypothetical protein
LSHLMLSCFSSCSARQRQNFFRTAADAMRLDETILPKQSGARQAESMDGQRYDPSKRSNRMPPEPRLSRFLHRHCVRELACFVALDAHQIKRSRICISRRTQDATEVYRG